MLHYKTIFLISNLYLLTFFSFPNQKEKLIIMNEKNKTHFYVEIAKTKKQRLKGLMYRTKLPKQEGMLFIFPNETIIKMWMKNTFIPLDIIFISSEKEIVDIKNNMKELSHSVITSKIESKYVLEINAGLINKFNITIGDKVHFYE